MHVRVLERSNGGGISSRKWGHVVKILFIHVDLRLWEDWICITGRCAQSSFRQQQQPLPFGG